MVSTVILLTFKTPNVDAAPDASKRYYGSPGGMSGIPNKVYDLNDANAEYDTCLLKNSDNTCRLGACLDSNSFGAACIPENCRTDSSLYIKDGSNKISVEEGDSFKKIPCAISCNFVQGDSCQKGVCTGPNCTPSNNTNVLSGQDCGWIYGLSYGESFTCPAGADNNETDTDGGDTQPSPEPTPKCTGGDPEAEPVNGQRPDENGCWCAEIGENGNEQCFNSYAGLFNALQNAPGGNQCQGRVQGNVTVTGVDGASGNVVAFKNGFRYSGATVNLLKNGKVIDTTKTNDTKGIYKFTGLDSGEHEVELKVPSGYKLVSKAGTVEKSTQNPKDFNIDSCDDEDHQGWIIEKTGGGDADDNDDNNSPPPSDKKTVKIELAEDPGITNNVVSLTSFSLDSAGNVLSDYTFSDPTPGIKNLCARFTADDGTEEVKCKQIEIVADVPEITDISCVRSGSSVVFDIGGNFFGTTAGRVQSGEATLSLQGAWSQSQVKAVLNSAPSQETYPVKLIRFDGVSDETTCSPAGEIALSVGANYFCSAVPNHVENNVSFVVYDGDNPSASSEKLADETVKINGSGVIEGLNFVFEEGRNYIVSIQSPRSLVRFGEFVAGPQTGGQTNIIDIGLPIGDIAPAPAGDGVINSLDKSLLNRQWDLTKDVERTGDFNDDQRVNSVDWACMRNDFNATDETLDEFAAQDSDEETEEEETDEE